ncbi:MAG: Mu-like prophage major head subunit gpT family protein, partial [Acidobacteriota bacterium]
LLPRLARIHAPNLAGIRRAASNPKVMDFEWLTVFPEMREWLGDRVAQTSLLKRWTAEVKPYEITLSVDRDDLETGSYNAGVLAEFAKQQVGAYTRGKMRMAYQLMSRNPLTAWGDGAQLFSTSHVDVKGETRSNVLTFEKASNDPAAPLSMLDAYEVVEQVASGLRRNAVLPTQLLDVGEALADLTVFVRRDMDESAFRQLSTSERLGGTDGERNPWTGKLKIIRDPLPEAAYATSIDVVWSLPNGPRPIVLGVQKEVGRLEVDDQQAFRNRKLDLGTDARYALMPAFWQSCYRAKDLTGA